MLSSAYGPNDAKPASRGSPPRGALPAANEWQVVGVRDRRAREMVAAAVAPPTPLSTPRSPRPCPHPDDQIIATMIVVLYMYYTSIDFIHRLLKLHVRVGAQSKLSCHVALGIRVQGASAEQAPACPGEPYSP